MVMDAIKGYITSLKKHKEYIPTDEGGFFANIEIRKKTSAYA